MLDEEHEEFKSQVVQDNNSYVLGRVHEHNVVLACLPAGVYGTVSATTVASNMLRTFTGIRFGLMVGIGGGIPDLNKRVDVRLGDVVVSQPSGTHGGVVQYDLGKNLGEGVFERKGFLKPPPTLLLTALASLQSRHQMYGNQILRTITEMIQRLPRLAKSGYMHPGSGKDLLYCSNVEGHKNHETCTQCDNGLISRKLREDQSPEVHYGIIASGNELMKNVVERDRLGREFGAKCIEMEAAGLMNDFPCIVIRGICDYADSHKNDVWQEYAAVTAAAYAKELLSVVRRVEVGSIQRAAEAMNYNLGLNLFDAPDMGEGLFIGREAELKKMEKILQVDSESLGSVRKTLVLGGMGGIGKTQLAISFAKRHRSSFSSVFWLNATSEATLRTSFRSVVNRLLPLEEAQNLDDEQVYIFIANWFSEQENKRWLLIFDNHDGPDRYDITKYYPSVAHGSIITTTRVPHDLRGEHIKLSSMNEENDDGLRILASRSGRQDLRSDPGAQLLARRLDGFPLALATAGAFLKQSPIDCSTYLKRYEEVWKLTRTTVSQLPEYPGRTLYTTWNLSLARIEEEMPQAVQLLAFLAYLDHQDIWYELLCAGGEVDKPLWLRELTNDKFAFVEAMMVLTKYCLVETHYDTDSYSLHTCVHDWTLDGLNHQIDASRYWLAFDCVSSHIGAADRRHLSEVRYRRFTGHARRLAHDRFMGVANQYDAVRVRCDQIDYLAQLLKQQKHHNEAEKMYVRALAGKELKFGKDDLSTLYTVNNLAVLYLTDGRLPEAERLHLRALAGFEQVLGSKHSTTLEAVSNLGLLYQEQGRVEVAESLYLRALVEFERALGRNHPSTLKAATTLGVLYERQGRLGEAERLHLWALAGFEPLSGYHRTVRATIKSLGSVYQKQDRLADAEQLYSRALANFERTLGSDHSSTLQTVNDLGLLYEKQDRLAEAEQLHLRALTGFERALGRNHMSTLEAATTLALTYWNQGRLAEAGKQYSWALAGFEQALGGYHTLTLQTLNDLGLVYWNQDRPAEAEAMYLQALVGFEKAPRSGITPRLALLHNIYLLYREQGRVEEAETILQRAVVLQREKLFGPEHART